MAEVASVDTPDALAPDTLHVGFLFDGDEGSPGAGLPAEMAQRAGSLLRAGHLKGSLYEATILDGVPGQPDVLLVGGGRRGELEPLTLMRASAAASRYATGRGYTRLAYRDMQFFDGEAAGHAIVLGAHLGSYDPGIRKTRGDAERRLESVTVVCPPGDGEATGRGLELGRIVGESALVARTLVNLPPNELTPSHFADLARQMGEEAGLQVEVLDEEDIARLGMGALLGVAAGSSQPPRVIVIRYGPADAVRRLALCGKGLTFDSGGLSIKTAQGMETMKGDMGGAAAVLGGMLAIARLRPENVSVTGYIGATENMPGGGAMRPGDILTALSGETIEVLNTDAEGRLVLADLLTYAEREGATHLVDLATLTGGAQVALGNAASLACGRPSDWVGYVVDAAAGGLERVWQMPLYPEYRKAMNSEFADIKNSGGRYASALTATAFLSDFVKETPWAHIDIAGTSFADEATPYAPKGGTGVGVGTIVSLVRRLSTA